MAKITATVPASHQKDGVAFLALEFDIDTDGWYLYGHSDLSAPALFDLWNMNEEDAKDMAANDWGVLSSEWNDEDDGTNVVTRDFNGAELKDGDTVTLIKDLDVKGAGVTLKRGTTVKNISLTNDPELIDCRTKEVKGLVLKTCFVKKI